MKPLKRGTITILGSPWEYTTVDPDTFARDHGKDVPAVCLSTPPRLLFAHGQVTKGTIRHELLHAYLFTLPLRSVELSPDQLEEIVADILADHWDTMGRQTREIFKKLT
jgi:hypothetical protein